MSRLHRQKQVAELLHREGFIGREFGDFFRHERNGHWTKAQLNLGKVELWHGKDSHSDWLGAIRWDNCGNLHTEVPRTGHSLVGKLLAALARRPEASKPRPVTMTLTAAMRDGQWYGYGPDVQIPLHIKGLEVGTRYKVLIEGGIGKEVLT